MIAAQIGAVGTNGKERQAVQAQTQRMLREDG